MRKIIWSPKAFQDYTSVIDYLNTTWTTKEVQLFVDKVMAALSILERGDSEFKKLAFRIIE